MTDIVDRLRRNLCRDLLQENHQLRAALRPFAEWAQDMLAEPPTWPLHNDDPHSPTVKDVFIARRALEQKERQ